MSRYKVYYNKGLKMSPEKLASQVAHITLNLGSRYAKGIDPLEQVIIVLGLSNKKFNEMIVSCEEAYPQYHKQVDLGYTEVEKGTITAFGFIEE